MNNVDVRDPLQALVAALQGRQSLRVLSSSTPLVQRCLKLTVIRCERLVASVGGGLGVEGADIALEAWERVLRRLASGSLVVADEHHFERLLMRAVRNCFIDHLDRNNRFPLSPRSRSGEPPMPDVENCAARETAVGDLLLGANSERLRWVERLFLWDDAQWARRGPLRLRRSPRQYRALVLFHLADMVRAEESERGAALVDRYAQLLAVAPEVWEPVVTVARRPAVTDADVLAVVNEVCRTSILDRSVLSVLRYEFARAIQAGVQPIPRYDLA